MQIPDDLTFLSLFTVLELASFPDVLAISACSSLVLYSRASHCVFSIASDGDTHLTLNSTDQAVTQAISASIAGIAGLAVIVTLVSTPKKFQSCRPQLLFSKGPETMCSLLTMADLEWPGLRLHPFNAALKTALTSSRGKKPASSVSTRLSTRR